jgi:hypothetical protein
VDSRGKSPSADAAVDRRASQRRPLIAPSLSYAERDQTRREHFIELLNEYCWRSFGLHERRKLSTRLMNQARSTDQGIALVVLLIDELRHRHIMVPVLPVLERLTIFEPKLFN